MKIDKEKFIYNPTLLSNYFLGKAFDKLTKEQQDELCNAEELDIKMSINGIDIPFPSIEEFLYVALQEQFMGLMDKYLQNKYGDTFNKVQERLSTTSCQVRLVMDELQDCFDNLKEEFKEGIK